MNLLKERKNIKVICMYNKNTYIYAFSFSICNPSGICLPECTDIYIYIHLLFRIDSNSLLI